MTPTWKLFFWSSSKRETLWLGAFGWKWNMNWTIHKQQWYDMIDQRERMKDNLVPVILMLNEGHPFWHRSSCRPFLFEVKRNLIFLLIIWRTCPVYHKQEAFMIITNSTVLLVIDKFQKSEAHLIISASFACGPKFLVGRNELGSRKSNKIK